MKSTYTPIFRDIRYFALNSLGRFSCSSAVKSMKTKTAEKKKNDKLFHYPTTQESEHGCLHVNKYVVYGIIK